MAVRESERCGWHSTQTYFSALSCHHPHRLRNSSLFGATVPSHLITSAEQIREISHVTRHPKIRAQLAPALAGRLVNQLRDLAIVVPKIPKVDRSPDPDDNHLLALAEDGEAQFLVTGDKQLLSLKHHKFTHIITPAALVELLR